MRAAESFRPSCDAWIQGRRADFSRSLGARGWLGMTWPQRYGGGGRSALERFTVLEELLAAGAPVAAHWIADRQTGPLLLRSGTEAQKQRFLPAIARGRLFVAAGMSEPDSGSDLASVRTRAVQTATGWRVTGRKAWTSHAHRSHFLLTLGTPVHATTPARRAQPDADRARLARRDGAADRGHDRRIRLHRGHPRRRRRAGRPGRRPGWRGVVSELAHERSGPERYLSTFPLLAELVSGGAADREASLTDIGSATARLWALRTLSPRVQDLLERGSPTDTAAALVKDLGTRLEGEIIEITRRAAHRRPGRTGGRALSALLEQAQLAAPSFTLRGGTNEILRGMVARGLEA